MRETDRIWRQRVRARVPDSLLLKPVVMLKPELLKSAPIKRDFIQMEPTAERTVVFSSSQLALKETLKTTMSY